MATSSSAASSNAASTLAADTSATSTMTSDTSTGLERLAADPHLPSRVRKIYAEIDAALKATRLMRRRGATGALVALTPPVVAKINKKVAKLRELQVKLPHAIYPGKTWDVTAVGLGETDELNRMRARMRALAFSARGVDFAPWEHGIYPAGGVVENLIRAKEDLPHDADWFVVGVDVEQAAKKLGDAFLACVQAEDRTHYVSCHRTRGCVTFIHRTANGCARGVAHQVILTKYATLDEVLLGFDLGSSSFLWDGADVLATPMGVVALKYGVNVLDLRMRRSTYETRLCKYFRDGGAHDTYGILLPHVDLAGVLKKLLEPYSSLELPRITFRRIRLSKPSCPYGQTHLYADGVSTEEIQGTSGGDVGVMYRYDIEHECSNLAAVVYGLPAALCGCEPWAPGLEFAAIRPRPASREVLVGLVRSKVRSVSRSNLMYLSKLFTKGELSDIVTALTSGKTAALASGKVPVGTPPRTIEQICAEAYPALVEQCRLPFAVRDIAESTSLLAPDATAAMTAAEWYGDYYAAPPSEKMDTPD